MRHPATLFCLLLLYLAGHAAIARAQTEPPPPRHLRVLTYELELVDTKIRAGGGAEMPLVMPPYLPGPYVQLPPNTDRVELTFRLRFSPPETPPQKLLVPLAKAGTHDLVVISRAPPDPEGRPVFVAKVLPEDAQNFPGGHIRLINMLKAPVAVRIGSQTTLLQPGEIRFSTAPLDKRNRAVAQIAVETNGVWHSLGYEILVLGPQSRGSLLTVLSPSGLGIMHFDREVIDVKSDSQLHVVSFTDPVPVDVPVPARGTHTASLR